MSDDPDLDGERGELPRLLIRWSLAFALLFAAVFFMFWWSGSAIRFSAARVSDSSVPTYRIWGIVRNGRTGEAIPWAKIEDDPAGNPPLYHADSDQYGGYSLLTLAEPHRIRISASGYKPQSVGVGRHWFVWWPRGAEKRDIYLVPEF